MRQLYAYASNESTLNLFSIECGKHFAIALVLLTSFFGWLKTRAIFSTNITNQNHTFLCRTRFPSLGGYYVYLL